MDVNAELSEGRGRRGRHRRARGAHGDAGAGREDAFGAAGPARQLGPQDRRRARRSTRVPVADEDDQAARRHPVARIGQRAKLRVAERGDCEQDDAGRHEGLRRRQVHTEEPCEDVGRDRRGEHARRTVDRNRPGVLARVEVDQRAEDVQRRVEEADHDAEQRLRGDQELGESLAQRLHLGTGADHREQAADHDESDSGGDLLLGEVAAVHRVVAGLRGQAHHLEADRRIRAGRRPG